MAKVTITDKTASTPQQFVEALTDFGPQRGKIWGNSQASYLTVHDRGDNWAEVTEGSTIFGGVWERLHYDWSNPHEIILTTIDSNLWSNRSGWRYSLHQNLGDEMTIIKYTIERFPKNNKARLVMLFVAIVGKPIIRRDFRRTLQAIEQRPKQA